MLPARKLLTVIALAGVFHAGAQPVASFLTDPSAHLFFSAQNDIARFTELSTKKMETVHVDDLERHQQIDGFGFALTGGSAMHLMKMSAGARKSLLHELFATAKGSIGTSYLRLSIGASDLNEHVFSYDDLAPGETDTAMLRFDLGPDRNDVIPVLHQILAIQPGLHIMASPWSPPSWMKSNRDSRGGSLLKEYYPAYALYFVRYIQQMRKAGIIIDAVTVQNEPLHPANNPSLLLPAADEAVFVRDYLGPAFRKQGIKTKIVIYDHNADRPDYPISILDDPEAAKYIDGSAFHLYAGSINALSEVHNAHPGKNIYFTEQWVGGPGNAGRDIPEHTRNLIIGATRNWSRTVIEWNLSSDPQYRPFTDRGGCTTCLGAVTIDGDAVTRNPAYYIIAHAAKWVRPGSVHIASSSSSVLPSTAFKRGDGKIVLIVLNDSKIKQRFAMQFRHKAAEAVLNPGAVATYMW